MKDRIFRFSFVGITLIISIIFWYWLLGGDIYRIFKLDFNLIAKISIPIITSPIIGFLITSTSIGIIKSMYNKKLEYDIVLQDKTYLEYIHSKFKEDSGINVVNDIYTISDKKTVSLNHNILFRTISKEEIINYALRRFDVFYSIINFNFAVYFAFIFGLLFRLYFDSLTKEPASYEFSIYKLLLILPIVIISVFSLVHAFYAKKEALEFEARVLIYHNHNLS